LDTITGETLLLIENVDKLIGIQNNTVDMYMFGGQMGGTLKATLDTHGDALGEIGTGAKMNEAKINQLLALSKKRVEISDKKMEVVSKQRYEEAAALRDQERKILEEIDAIVDVDENKFETKEIFYEVMKDFHKVIDFIEEGDSNLTPALLRKLTNDVKEARSREANLKKEIQKFEWINSRDEKPTLVREIKEGGEEWMESDEVMILNVKDSGEHGICIAKYVEEWLGLNRKNCNFQVVEDVRDSFEKSNNRDTSSKDPKRLRGWQDIPGLRVKGWMPLPEKKISRRR
jgi:hypothetical protein